MTTISIPQSSSSLCKRYLQKFNMRTTLNYYRPAWFYKLFLSPKDSFINDFRTKTMFKTCFGRTCLVIIIILKRELLKHFHSCESLQSYCERYCELSFILERSPWWPIDPGANVYRDMLVEWKYTPCRWSQAPSDFLITSLLASTVCRHRILSIESVGH